MSFQSSSILFRRLAFSITFSIKTISAPDLINFATSSKHPASNAFSNISTTSIFVIYYLGESSKVSGHLSSMSSHHGTHIRLIMMCGPCWIRVSTIPFCTIFHLFLNSFNEPSSLPDWYVVSFGVMKSKIIHK